jgi:hypothetical protein
LKDFAVSAVYNPCMGILRSLHLAGKVFALLPVNDDSSKLLKEGNVK